MTSKICRLELRRGQISIELNPCAFFGVRDNAMTVYALADVKESVSDTGAIKSIRRSQVTDGTDESNFWSTKMAFKSPQSAKIAPRASRAFSAMRTIH